VLYCIVLYCIVLYCVVLYCVVSCCRVPLKITCRLKFSTSDAVNYIDSYDDERFLSDTTDLALYRNAIAMTILSEGIPMIYYGTEQAFNGPAAANHEPLWTSEYNTEAELYQFIKKLLAIRAEYEIHTYPQLNQISDFNFFSFTR